MGAGMTQSPRRERVVHVPQRHEARFRHQARFVLVLVTTLAAALAAYATAKGAAEFTPVMIAIAVIPLLGGLVGLWRLVAAWEAGPGRAHVVLAAFSLGLVSWATTIFVYLIERARVGPPRVSLRRRHSQLPQRSALDDWRLAALRRGS